jgi:preprotein translocase subunit SecG
MLPIDEEYLKRREKEIKEMHENRMIAGIMFALALAATAGTGGLINAGTGAGNVLAIIVGIFAGIFWLATLIAFGMQWSKNATERDIRAEYERVRELVAYGSSTGSPKRKNASESIARLTDDGELSFDDDEQSREKSKGRA